MLTLKPHPPHLTIKCEVVRKPVPFYTHNGKNVAEKHMGQIAAYIGSKRQWSQASGQLRVERKEARADALAMKTKYLEENKNARG